MGFFLLASLLVSAAADESPEQCAVALDELVGRVERSYAGYHIEVVRSSDRIAEYRRFLEGLRRRTVQESVAGCHFVLRDYVNWFRDPHLFVIENPRFEPAELPSHQVPRSSLDLALVSTRLRESPLDPIEGLWRSSTREIAIVRASRPGRYVAVSMTESEDTPPGQIIGWFEPSDDGYEATLIARDRTLRRSPASLQKNLLLHMPPNTWGRRAPLSALEGRLINAEHPRGPTFVVLGEDAALISIPSFAPEHRAALAAIVETNDAAIRARDLLIVDLRGNEGGSSGLGRLIEPYYAPFPHEGGDTTAPTPLVLSSPDVVSCVEGQIENLPESEYRSLLRTLLTSLQANPGRLVPMPGSSPGTTSSVEAQAMPRPRQVAFLLDRHPVSAAEAVLLRARRSEKVTLFGENSGGSIDYQNVCVTGFGNGPLRHLLGFPSIASSDRLPVGGYNRAALKDLVPAHVSSSPVAHDQDRSIPAVDEMKEFAPITARP